MTYKPPFGFGQKQAPKRTPDDEEADEADSDEEEGSQEPQRNPYNYKTQPNKYQKWNREHPEGRTPGFSKPVFAARKPYSAIKDKGDEDAAEVIENAGFGIPDDLQVTLTVGRLREIIEEAIGRA